MRQTLRPSGSGKDGTAEPFQRSVASPRAALVLTSVVDLPDDWSPAPASTEDNLAHALGWTIEIRRHDVVLLNPLGEGTIKAPLPELAPGWLQTLRQDSSCAVFLSTSATGALEKAGTVRASIADDYGKVDPVGRNAPCPCGSGKKYKHCCA